MMQERYADQAGGVIYDHLVKCFGEPANLSRFEFGDPKGSFLFLSFEGYRKNSTVFASVGLSRYATQSVEVFVVVSKDTELVEETLAGIFASMLVSNLDMHPEVAVKGGRSIPPEFLELYGKSALLFSHPYPVGYENAIIESDQGEIDLLMVAFITQDEYDYFLAGGDLEEIFETQKINPAILTRPSCLQVP